MLPAVPLVVPLAPATPETPVVPPSPLTLPPLPLVEGPRPAVPLGVPVEPAVPAGGWAEAPALPGLPLFPDGPDPHPAGARPDTRAINTLVRKTDPATDRLSADILGIAPPDTSVGGTRRAVRWNLFRRRYPAQDDAGEVTCRRAFNADQASKIAPTVT